MAVKPDPMSMDLMVQAANLCDAVVQRLALDDRRLQGQGSAATQKSTGGARRELVGARRLASRSAVSQQRRSRTVKCVFSDICLVGSSCEQAVAPNPTTETARMELTEGSLKIPIQTRSS